MVQSLLLKSGASESILCRLGHNGSGQHEPQANPKNVLPKPKVELLMQQVPYKSENECPHGESTRSVACAHPSDSLDQHVGEEDEERCKSKDARFDKKREKQIVKLVIICVSVKKKIHLFLIQGKGR